LVITAVVVTVNAGLTVAPAAIVTEAGTETAALFEASVTTAPPAGAAALSVTVLPPNERPPTIPAPASWRVSVFAALTFIVAVCELPFALAVITDEELVTTASVVTLKLAVVAPAATVTVAGTVAADVVPDARLTVKPPVGAAELIVTVPTDVPAPVTVVGLRLRALTVGAVIASDAVVLLPASVAVTVAEALAATAVVVTLKFALVDPAGMVTVAGTVAAALLDASVMLVPPVGAALLIVTVATDVVPPTTVVGFRVSAVMLSGVTVSVAV